MTIGSEPDLKEYFKKIYEKAFDNIIERLETCSTWKGVSYLIALVFVELLTLG